MSTKDKVLLGFLVFVPLCLLAEAAKLNPLVIFVISGLAIIPLAARIAESTEEIATVVGPSLGGFLNATFGNATEMVVSILALRSGLVDVVKASITGGIISNLLLALGMASFFGGLRFSEQSYQPAVARINSSALTLAVIVLITPTAIEATSEGKLLPGTLTQFSYAASALLLAFYGLMMLFSMKTHRHLFLLEAAEEEMAGTPVNLKLQIGILLGSTLVLVLVSETLVDSLEKAINTLGLTDLFTGVILIPIFGGIVEYITSITLALKNKMDLAVAVAIGSSLQTALFVAPILVFVGFLIGQPMNLSFNTFEIIAVAMAVLITNSISSDGRSHWLEGVLLLITYVVLGIAFFLHPEL
jgi:Ca2+:H+ antiporter